MCQGTSSIMSPPPQESLPEMEPARRQWDHGVSRRYLWTSLSAWNQPCLIPLFPRAEPFLLKGTQAGLLAPGEKGEEREQKEESEWKDVGEERKGTPKLVQLPSRARIFSFYLFPAP